LTDQDQKKRILSGQEIGQAAGIVALAFVLSGVLGVIRQAIIGASFGASSGELDAFYAAYRIPELLFTLVAGGALGSAFIPIFARFLGQDDLEGAWRLASAVITLIALAAGALALVAGIFAPWITANLLIPEAAPTQQALTTELMRIMLVTVVIFAVSGLIMGILNANFHFVTPALAPSMNNLGLIIGALLLAPRFGVYGLAGGAVLGALLHAGIQLPALRHVEPRLRIMADLRIPGVVEVLKLMGPRVLGQGVVQINFLVNTVLASGMVPGSYAALTIAFQLMFTVLGVLGQSVGTAVFPSLVAFGVDSDMDGFRRTLAGALRSVLFTSLPASVGMIVLAVPIVATIYERGRWSPDDTIATAWALQFFALGLSAFAMQEVLARAFFALRDTTTPVVIAIGGMILNVILSLLLIRVVQGQYNPPGQAGQGPFGGLALANTLATMIESVVLWLLLRRRINGLEDRQVLSMAVRVLIAALAMGGIVLFAANVLSQNLNQQAPLLVLIVGAIVGMLAFEGIAVALQVPEARTVPLALLRRFRR
jgi:putative peptidoglycan lipid II flippase